MGNGKTRFMPKTRKEIFDSMIKDKRDMITAGETKWTSEAPSDFGITLLSVVASVLEDHEDWIDLRTKQACLINASHVESIRDNSRSLGYIGSPPKMAMCLTRFTATESTFVPINTQLKKTLNSGKTIYFETLSPLTFTAAGTKEVYVAQGRSHTLSVTGTGQPRQQIFFARGSVPNGLVLVIAGEVWDRVTTFQYSLKGSLHYRIEYDYYGRPIIIFGDGVFGKMPPKDSEMVFTFFTTEGALGNVPPGTMELTTPIDAISLIQNEGPVTGELALSVTTSSTVITFVDDQSINGFSESGVAYIDEDSFTYDGKVGLTLTNVTGLSESHSAGEIIRYSLESVMGEDAESLLDIKTGAMRANKIKSSANSTLDYSYLATKVSGVKRAFSYQLAHTMFVQVIPSYGGVPSEILKQTVHDYLYPLRNGRHLIKVMDPKYVYMDLTIEVTPFPGISYEEVVKPYVELIVKNFFSPTTTYKDEYYTSTWGTTVRKENLTYLLLYLLGGRYIVGVNITEFRPSIATFGNSNVELEFNEITNMGELTLVNLSEDINPGTLGATAIPISV